MPHPDVALGWARERHRASKRAIQRGAVRLQWSLSLWWFPAHTLILHYHVLPDRTYLFRIARRHIDVVVLPVGRLHLANDMHELVEDETAMRRLAIQIGIADALEQFPGVRRLVIVPHDAVAGIPFAALPIKDRRLCSIVPITQVDRLERVLCKRRVEVSRTGLFLSAGRANYAGSGHGDLADAEREAAAVIEASCRMDTPRCNATRTGVLAELPGATWFHVAAHGVFDMSDPARSGIVLGNGAGGYETLTLRELRDAKLHRLQLATLATCRSGEHARLPGRERICLPTALLDAGARGVIASLWRVDDAASVDVMAALYRELATKPPATALADMQAAMAKYRPAKQWAGWVFYGND